MKSSNKELSEAIFLSLAYHGTHFVHNECRSADFQGLITVIAAFLFFNLNSSIKWYLESFLKAVVTERPAAGEKSFSRQHKLLRTFVLWMCCN